MCFQVYIAACLSCILLGQIHDATKPFVLIQGCYDVIFLNPIVSKARATGDGLPHAFEWQVGHRRRSLLEHTFGHGLRVAQPATRYSVSQDSYNENCCTFCCKHMFSASSPCLQDQFLGGNLFVLTSSLLAFL